MCKFGVCIFFNKTLDRAPFILLVSNSFAYSADGQHTSESFDLGRGVAEMGLKCFKRSNVKMRNDKTDEIRLK